MWLQIGLFANLTQTNETLPKHRRVMKRIILCCMCVASTILGYAQPKQFSFYMLQPNTFVEVVANNALVKLTPSTKATRVKNAKIYKGTLLPVVKNTGKWLNVEFFTAKKLQSLWLQKSQCRLLTVAAQTECVMPPAFQVESADGSIGGVIEGPDARFQVRSEGIYRNLPYSVAHAPGSDNYSLQFMVAGNNPNYTYVINTSFVVTHDAKDKASVSVVRDVENGKLVYETLYVSIPRTIANEDVENFVSSYLINCSDGDFAKVISTAFPHDGVVQQVTMYFKATNGKRYAYTYNASEQPHGSYFFYNWKFVE